MQACSLGLQNIGEAGTFRIASQPLGSVPPNAQLIKVEVCFSLTQPALQTNSELFKKRHIMLRDFATYRAAWCPAWGKQSSVSPGLSDLDLRLARTWTYSLRVSWNVWVFLVSPHGCVLAHQTLLGLFCILVGCVLVLPYASPNGPPWGSSRIEHTSCRMHHTPCHI